MHQYRVVMSIYAGNSAVYFSEFKLRRADDTIIKLLRAVWTNDIDYAKTMAHLGSRNRTLLENMPVTISQDMCNVFANYEHVNARFIVTHGPARLVYTVLAMPTRVDNLHTFAAVCNVAFRDNLFSNHSDENVEFINQLGAHFNSMNEDDQTYFIKYLLFQFEYTASCHEYLLAISRVAGKTLDFSIVTLILDNLTAMGYGTRGPIRALVLRSIIDLRAIPYYQNSFNHETVRWIVRYVRTGHYLNVHKDIAHFFLTFIETGRITDPEVATLPPFRRH
jgi:hypothetical protein